MEELVCIAKVTNWRTLSGISVPGPKYGEPVTFDGYGIFRENYIHLKEYHVMGRTGKRLEYGIKWFVPRDKFNASQTDEILKSIDTNIQIDIGIEEAELV